MYRIHNVNFQDFINKKFLEWQLTHGARKTVDEFAEYLGIQRSLVSMWMNGKRNPGPKYKNQLINALGDDAAEYFGEDPRLSFINQNWDKASENLQRSIHEQLQREIAKNEAQQSHSQRKKAIP